MPLVLNSGSFEYTLKKYKRSKTIKILIRNNGEIVVTAPERISKKYIEKFLKSNDILIQKKLEGVLEKSTTLPQLSKDDFKVHKEAAHELVLSKIEKLNKHYNFSFRKIFIRNQKTRWGSCSSQGNLNFSYKLVHIADHLVEYIVAHELCHLQEMNHGQNFWKLVEQTIPDYKKARQELMKIKI